MIAYVLINTEIGTIQEVLESIKKIKEIREAYALFGVYDIMTKVEAESTQQLKKIVTLKIRHIDKVRSTLTMIIME
ncbi:Lrp/AsnC ligand binding domain-containing protein [Candidatus Bathyarchaeota archaeon]|nr:Lrp/AsnC ligand binding domain-containing protein [Candidatus Bathyarchaeota archaeon]